MLYNLHLTMLNNFGLSLWDVLSLVVGVIMVVIIVVHKNNHKKRREEFEKNLDEKIKAIKEEQSIKDIQQSIQSSEVNA